MKTSINLIFLFKILIYLIQIQLIIGFRINKLHSEINCSQYGNDGDIINSFPFNVPLNPDSPETRMTHALMNTSVGKVVHLKIVNQESVPPLIYCLKHLSELEIVNTSFLDSKHGLPADIEVFASSLTKLRVSDTKITYLPYQIGKLKRLQELKFSNTSLKSLPNSIGNLRLLRSLILVNNNLSSLPTTMKNLQSLHNIALSNNSYLRSVESLNGLPNLTILIAKHCPIEHIPRDLPKLETLIMSSNNLIKLNYIETLGNATNSKKSFDFDGNRIDAIPPQIIYVRNLHQLNLCCNNLTVLPTEIYSITTLSQLNIKRNQFNLRRLKSMVDKFRQTNPKLKLLY